MTTENTKQLEVRGGAGQGFTEEMVKALLAPLHSKAISAGTRGLSSIKPVYITERLNQVFGMGRWNTKSTIVELGDRKGTNKEDKTLVVVQVQMFLLDYPWFYAEAYGGNQNADLGDSYKGAVSDAMSKICVNHFGIGADVFKGHGDAPSKAAEAEQLKEEQRRKKAEADAASAASGAAKTPTREEKAEQVKQDQATVANPPNCEDCHQQITSITGGDKKVYDAADLIKSSQKKYKADLCAACQKKRRDDLAAQAEREPVRKAA